MSRFLPTSVGPVVRVAEALGPLLPGVVFLGGAVLPLLLTDPAAPPARGTEDVDVVLEALSRVAYYEFESALRERGFRNDTSEGAPVCRWLIEGIKVDVMPPDPSVVGFSNPWYPEAMGTAERYFLEAGLEIHLIAAPDFLATKLTAFQDRGKGDYLGSSDLEDIVILVDGRPEIVGEVARSRERVRRFIAESCRGLLATKAFREALPAHLDPDEASQDRASIVLGRFLELAQLEER